MNELARARLFALHTLSDEQLDLLIEIGEQFLAVSDVSTADKNDLTPAHGVSTTYTHEDDTCKQH